VSKSIFPGESPAKEERRIAKLIKGAEMGDKKAISLVRKELNSESAIWEQMGNLAFQAKRAMVEAAVGDREILQKAVYRKLAKMHEELAGPAPTPLEQLLVERVLLCWLHVHYADAVYAQRMKDLGREWGEYFQRRQDRAHRRYLSSIRTLAQVRRLLTPPVQVNVGARQMNVVQVAKSSRT